VDSPSPPGPRVSDERRDSSCSIVRFTSHLVTRCACKGPLDVTSQWLEFASSLVALMRRISSGDQWFERFSALVAAALLSALFDVHAMPAPAARAAGRRSSPGSQASAANAVDWLSCWLRGIRVRSNSAVHAREDQSETASGSTGTDAVYSSCSQATTSFLACIMPFGRN
jgi:hypothetical protein